MSVRLHTDAGTLEITLHATAAAARFRQLVASGAFASAAFFRANRQLVAFGPAAGSARSARLVSDSRERPDTRALRRGWLAFAPNSQQVVLVSRGAAAPHGPVIGELASPRSLRVIEEIANRPRSQESLLNPVKIRHERSEQLKEVMRFEQALRQHRLCQSARAAPERDEETDATVRSPERGAGAAATERSDSPIEPLRDAGAAS